MKLTNKQMIELKSLFLEKIPKYLEKKIDEISDDQKYEDYLNGIREKTKKIVVKTNRAFCKSISSIVSICLKHYGFENISLKNVQFLIGNEKAKITLEKIGFDRFVEIIKNKKDNEIYTLGVGFSEDHNDFHTVILINDDWLLDMTANQLNREEHGIYMRNFCLKLKTLSNKVKPIIFYAICNEEIEPDGFIFTHPKLELIINTICKGIAETLEIPFKPMNSISRYKQNPNKFNVAKTKYQDQNVKA